MPKSPTLMALCAVLMGHSIVSAAAADQVALLTNGNLLRGQIEQLADTVVVRTPTSQVKLPATQVQAVVNSLEEAYLAKSSHLPAHAHVARANLIRWCMRHQLKDAATQEFHRLASAQPDYPGLSALRQLIVQPSHHQAHAILPSQSPPHRDVQLAEEQRRALPKPAVTEFVRSIQPLLVNRCGNAQCHGKAASSPFTLLAGARGRSGQTVTHRNLGATLRQLGPHPSKQTLLWMSARNPHGTLPRAPLRPAEQMRLLAWIDLVTQSQQRTTGRAPGGVVQAQATLPRDGRDPFDPANFNTPPAVNEPQPVEDSEKLQLQPVPETRDGKPAPPKPIRSRAEAIEARLPKRR